LSIKQFKRSFKLLSKPFLLRWWVSGCHHDYLNC
jgi:hypothetical protein